jgi:hypothetical protein
MATAPETDIELNHISSHFDHSPAPSEHTPDPPDALAVNAVGSDSDHSSRQYEFLTGFSMWNLVCALMLSMLLLGLDINIVATVRVSPCVPEVCAACY